MEAWLRVRRASEGRNARLGARVRSGRRSQVSGSRASASGRSAAGGPSSLASGRGPFSRFGARADGGEHPGWVPPPPREVAGCPQHWAPPPRPRQPRGRRGNRYENGGRGHRSSPVETVARPAGRRRWRGGGVRAPPQVATAAFLWVLEPEPTDF